MSWAEAEKFLAKDKDIGPLVRKYDHCTIVKRSKTSYFQSLVREIAGQQLSIKAASTIFGRVEELLENEITPEKILKTHGNSFRKAGLSRAKSTYIKDLAKKLEIDKLDNLENEKVMEELIAVKGIGVWTAEMFMMFALARPDIFPVDDLGIRNAFKKLIGNYQPQSMVIYAKKWSPYRTVASWYLWRSLENAPKDQVA